MLNPAHLLHLRGGGGRGGSGHTNLTPAQRRALARAVEDLVRFLVHTVGWGWCAAIFGLLAAGGTALWTFDDWWPPVSEWLKR